jgi:hypothetical protein
MFFRSPITSIGLRKTVAYVLAIFCYPCPGRAPFRCPGIIQDAPSNRAELIRFYQPQVIDPDLIAY